MRHSDLGTELSGSLKHLFLERSLTKATNASKHAEILCWSLLYKRLDFLALLLYQKSVEQDRCFGGVF
jgi:hypothetical protein